VIVLPEVFGWSGRLKGICDTLGENFYVVMPDCHRGDTANGKPDIPGWVAETPWEGKVKLDFDAIFAHIKETSPSSNKVGAVGFCWGAWAGCKASSEGMELACIVGAVSEAGERWGRGRG
jgi:dienelactone hydrolase